MGYHGKADPYLSDDLEELRGIRDWLSDQLGAIDARISELEEARGNPELAELRSDYFASR